MKNIKTYLVKVRKLVFVIIAIVFVVTILSVANDKIAAASGKTESNSERKIGTQEDGKWVSLNAEKITEIGIENSLITEPGNVNKKADYEEIASIVENWIKSQSDTFVLSDVQNLSISKCDLFMINIDDASVSNVAYEFLFSNGEPVGYVMFYLVGWELQYNLSLLTPNSSGYYFDFLAEHEGKSFILLTIKHNGHSKSYFLDEDNNLYSASTGSVVDDILIEGDCYRALATEELCISYEEIVSQIESIY